MSKVIITALFSFSLLGGIFLVPNTAKAFPVFETNPALVGSSVENAAVNTVQTTKDTVLDGVAYALGEVAIQVVTNDIVTWINSGFHGSPAFVQDLGGFFTDVADRVAGGLIQDLGGGFLCSPFSADIRYTIEVGYYQSSSSVLADKFSCKLSDIKGNVDAFIDGQFDQGGFNRFFDIAVRPENNPYAVTFGIRQEIETQVNGAVQRESKLLDFGNGFLSKRECLQGETPPQCTGPVVTPGEVINSQLENALGLSFGRLSVADEINEIVGALLGQVVQQALGGVGGLVGASSSSGGRPPITNTTSGGNVPLQGNQNDLLRNVGDSINNTVNYGAVVQESVGLLQGSQVALDDALTCWQDKKPSDPSTTQLRAREDAVTARIQNLENMAQENSKQLTQLKNIFQQIRNAQTQSDVAAAEREYNSITNLVTQSDIAAAEREKKNIESDVEIDTAFAKQKKQECTTI